MKPYPEYKPTDLAWLPRVPKHWEVKRAKFVFKTINERSKTGEEELLSVSHITGVTKRKASVTMFKAESYVGYKVCQPNDLVINSMWAWMGALGISPLDGIVSTAYSVYRMDESQLAPRFASFLLRIKWYAQDFENRSKGIWTSRLMLSDDAFGNVLLALPPLDEQERIVRYLGARHREIESYIAAKRSLLLRLKELSAATISRAVTRGLNPNVAVKPSGVEWLGDVPEHWQVKKLAYCASLKSGDSITAQNIEEDSGDYPVYGGNGFRGYTTSFTHEGDYALIGRQGALCGNINYASGKFFASEHAVVVTPRPFILTSYLGELLRTMNLNQYSMTAAQPGLSVEAISKLKAPVPPLSEQAAIVAYLENQLAIIGEARSRIEREIELARELYQTLVANVVTGQVDVSEIDVGDAGGHVEDEPAIIEDELAEFEDELAEVEDE